MKSIIGFIYLTTNIINGKIYIGQHEIRKNRFNDLYLGSGGRKFKNALNKYGRENFKRKILKVCYSIEQLNDLEEYYIKKFNALDSKIGYNQLPGPIHLFNPSKLPEVKKMKSKRFSGKGNPMYGKTGELHPAYGKKLSAERIAKTSGSNNGMYGKPSPFKGRVQSEEAKKILSDKAKLRYKRKEDNPNFGKKWTEEQKMEQSRKVKEYYNWLYS